MSSPFDFGVQSFCFRNFKDNADVAEKVKQIGVSSIEICGAHADFNDLEGWKDIVKTYHDRGVDVISIGVQNFTGDPKERQWFECARAAGAKHISAHFAVDSFTEAVPKTAKLAEEYDMRIGLHNHGGYKFGGQPEVLGHILDLGGPRLGLCLDTGWAMQIGPRFGNPVQWVRDYADRLFAIHYTDYVFEPNGTARDTVVGQGTLDLPAFTAALQEIGFDGISVLEYESDPTNPVPALTECVNKMRSQARTTG